ncbi:hypothetical protein [Vibrio antiquarius]|uniref:hypothetical protein n=1 Tax=Vibrio antiquarius (strain Ex25) TaxID=150340 RepID=UPI00265D1056|nr:hypothetical protein [Vibrio antiquarius]MCS0045428.1 hypothetical protein [Vibrio antiquarius]
MPIANCILSPQVAANSSDSTGLIEKWGEHSGIDTSEMTVTVMRSDEQMGKEYGAICTLNLPNLWSPKAVSSLQVGLAKAISEHFSLKDAEVLVMTFLIESGLVVEGGKEVSW